MNDNKYDDLFGFGVGEVHPHLTVFASELQDAEEQLEQLLVAQPVSLDLATDLGLRQHLSNRSAFNVGAIVEWLEELGAYYGFIPRVLDDVVHFTYVAVTDVPAEQAFSSAYM